jgi:hypothetical protein
MILLVLRCCFIFVESTVPYYNYFVFPPMLLHFLTFSDLSDQNC